MEWEDTVMKRTDIEKEHVWMGESDLDVARKISERQAEISFKAGREAGIKEVVDWINERCLDEYFTDHYYDVGGDDLGRTKVGKMVAPNYRDWKAKLKEWEVSND